MSHLSCKVTAASGSSFGQQITISEVGQQGYPQSHSSELEAAKPPIAQGLRLVLGLLQILPLEYSWLAPMLLLLLDGFECLRDWWAYIRRKR